MKRDEELTQMLIVPVAEWREWKPRRIRARIERMGKLLRGGVEERKKKSAAKNIQMMQDWLGVPKGRR